MLDFDIVKSGVLVQIFHKITVKMAYKVILHFSFLYAFQPVLFATFQINKTTDYLSLIRNSMACRVV